VGNPTCPLLAWEDLSGLGVTSGTELTDSDWGWNETPKETPNAKVISNICMVKVKTPAGRVEVMLSVDSFIGKVTEDQVGLWLKTIADSDPEEGITTVRLGGAVCETGSYELPSATDDGSVENVNELYVACDSQVGTRHISLNVHVPEADKTMLLTPEQTKSILDKAVKRLKDAALGQRI
jgi:hypothetical protein